NHSSIVCWGVQNEVQMTSDTPVSRRLTRELAALVKELDPTRLSTQANMSYVANGDEFNRMTDLVGYNRYEGWYSGQAEDFAPWLDTFHSDNPDIPLAISEYGAEGIPAYHTDSPAVGDYTEEYHALLHETVWKIFEKRPFLWATYVWNMFDFGSAIRDEGGVKGMNNKGLVTFDRKIKKDAFYWYKAKWSKEPFVHITGRRYVERPQTQNAIKVYSNLKEVTLHLNEREIGTIQSSDGVFLFADVALEAGENRLEAVSGDCRDAIELRKVEHPNESYVCTQKQQGMSFSDNVANWNEKLAGINKDDIVITDDVYSTRDSFKDLFDNEEAKTAIVDLLGIDPSEKPMFKMAEKFSPDKIHQLKPDMMSEELLLLLNSRLTKIEKK
ncbi:MAG: glycoside hydrolase family 2 protein, partial [Proteobacteria bacterium]|nr:glycoside hydrolase family 2 protein [Pseudomonadota bacterium]